MGYIKTLQEINIIRTLAESTSDHIPTLIKFKEDNKNIIEFEQNN